MTAQPYGFSKHASTLNVAVNNTTAAYASANPLTFTRKAKEAFPVLSRERHLFKVVTIYVVDKFNFNLQKLQRTKDSLLGPLAK